MAVIARDREPCFVCERRQRERGQILCRVCIAWAEANPRGIDVLRLARAYRGAVEALERAQEDIASYQQQIREADAEIARLRMEGDRLMGGQCDTGIDTDAQPGGQ